MLKLAIITTHPIQYYAPIFKQLTQNKKIEPVVLYTWGEDCLKDKFDPGFGKKISWDIPLLEGYQYKFLRNTSKNPGSNHFNGIINPDIIQEINQHNPDALLVIGWSYKSHLQVLRHFKGKTPIYFRGDSHLLNEKTGFKKLFRRLFLNWIYSFVSYALYVGSNNKKYYLAHGLKEKQLFWVPHAIENSRYIDNNGVFGKKAEELREVLGIHTSDINILFAGKLDPVKQVHLLIEALRVIKDEKIHLTIVGEGKLEKRLKELSNGINNIHFMPFQNQSKMPIIYQMCDVFALTSKSETWGLSINEAMFCEKAILASDKVGCAVDLVKDGINGYLFQSGNSQDLINKIKLLVKEDLNAMGKKSKEIIDEWSMEILVNRLENTLLENFNAKN